MDGLQKNEIVRKTHVDPGNWLTRLPEVSRDPMLGVDNDGTILFLNAAAKTLLNEWEVRVGDTLPEDFLNLLNHCLESAVCAKTGVEIKVEGRQLMFIPVEVADSGFFFLYGHDVTWWRRTQNHLKLLANVFENVGESIVITDTHGFIKAVNPAFTTINGFTAEEVIGKTPRCLKSNRHDSEFYKWMWNDILKKGRWKGKIWNRRKNGETYPALLSISSIRDEAGEVTHYCSICNDITGRTASTGQWQIDTYHDPLTGLPTMQLFYDRLERAFRRAKNNNSMIGIVVVNLNGFKNFNVKFGYRQGDLLLQQVARRLQATCREDETLTRSAKDEFIMIVGVEDNRAESVAARAAQIMKTFSVPMSIQGSRFRASIRTGISVYPLDAADMHSLLEHAQKKVFRA